MSKKNTSYWWLVIMGGAIPVIIELSHIYQIPVQLTVLILAVITLIFCSTCLWLNANAKTSGEKWWQDNSAAGWRGY